MLALACDQPVTHGPIADHYLQLVADTASVSPDGGTVFVVIQYVEPSTEVAVIALQADGATIEVLPGLSPCPAQADGGTTALISSDGLVESDAGGNSVQTAVTLTVPAGVEGVRLTAAAYAATSDASVCIATTQLLAFATINIVREEPEAGTSTGSSDADAEDSSASDGAPDDATDAPSE